LNAISRSLTTLLLSLGLLATVQAEPSAIERSDRNESTVKTIHVIASSHWNLGNSSNEAGGTFPYHFNALPEVVKIDVKAHVDQVLDAALRHDDFYWTIEALWMFQA
jgi:hypothetical protein